MEGAKPEREYRILHERQKLAQKAFREPFESPFGRPRSCARSSSRWIWPLEGVAKGVGAQDASGKISWEEFVTSSWSHTMVLKGIGRL